MTSFCSPHVLVAHPCHELLLYGWIDEVKPVVHVLTDGSGHTSRPRIDVTAGFLRETGARAGSIFGRLADREAYAMILERNVRLLLSLAEELAATTEKAQPPMIVCDAVEGFNPVHDLCQLIAGAAISLTGRTIPLYAYPVVGSPRSFQGTNDGIAVELDDATHRAKMNKAQEVADLIAEVDALVSHYGADSYRWETFRRITDWTDLGSDATPMYERIGEDRIQQHHYDRVIRKRDHVIPLRDALCEALLERSCVF